MTLERLDHSLVELVDELSGFAPPAVVIDKRIYSPWMTASFRAFLRDHAVDTIVVSGTETEVCVLSTVLGAVDRGYRVIVATDAICSSADETHDAMLTIYHSRFGMQVEAVLEIIDHLPFRGSAITHRTSSSIRSPCSVSFSKPSARASRRQNARTTSTPGALGKDSRALPTPGSAPRCKRLPFLSARFRRLATATIPQS
jgi:hypothetical protein